MSVSHVDFLVEGYSMKEALQHLLPRLLPAGIGFDVFDLGSKSQFLKKVPDRLRGYRSWLPADRRIVLVIDADQDDCRVLRAKLDQLVGQAGLTSASCSQQRQGQVLVRIAIEMLEAWFIGDPAAFTAAYGQQFSTLGQKQGFRSPDQIRDPARRIEQLLARVPKHAGGLKKVELAADLSARMDVDHNTSDSFCRFRDGVRFLVSTHKEKRCQGVQTSPRSSSSARDPS